MSSDSATPGPTRSPAGLRRGLALGAVSALLVAGAAACGSDTGSGGSTAPDPAASTSGASSSSPAGPASGTASPSPSESPAESGDPVPSPVINKAVKAAMRAGFPALVPAGVPDGWSVVSAAYDRKRGGSWSIELTDADGASVTLFQATQKLGAFIAANLGADAQASGSADLGEYGTGVWQVYAGSNDGAAATIVTRIADTGVLVSGPDQDTVVALAELLLTAEDGGSGTGDG